MLQGCFEVHQVPIPFDAVLWGGDSEAGFAAGVAQERSFGDAEMWLALVGKLFWSRGAPQIPPLRYASAGMTILTGALPEEIVADQRPLGLDLFVPLKPKGDLNGAPNCCFGFRQFWLKTI